MALLAPVWGYLAAAFTGLLAVAGLYLKGRSDAKAAAHTAALTTDLKSRTTRDEVDRDVAREPDPVASLRDKWSRPEPVRSVPPDLDKPNG